MVALRRSDFLRPVTAPNIKWPRPVAIKLHKVATGLPLSTLWRELPCRNFKRSGISCSIVVGRGRGSGAAGTKCQAFDETIGNAKKV